MKKHQVIVTLIICAFAFMSLVFRPVLIPSEMNECEHAEGILVDIYEYGNDIVFRLHKDQTSYYINRGTERGISTDQLKSQLLGKEIVIKYPHHWTPLDPGGITKHLSVLIFEDEILFTEI